MLHDSWSEVELRHLSTLAAVARTGSFQAAADRLGCAKSAVSERIARLERIAGVRLVERSRGSRGTCLTAAGDLLAGHAGEILARLEMAREDLLTQIDGDDTPVLPGRFVRDTSNARLAGVRQGVAATLGL